MPKRERWNERYASGELTWSAAPNKLFSEETLDLAPGKALDVACGEGRNAIWLAEQGWEVIGIDFSDVATGKGKQIADKRSVKVNWITEDVSTYQLPKSEFDLVAILYLHTDPAERQRWLTNALDSVKPNGTFIYIGHDPSNIDHGVGGPQDAKYLPSVEEFTYRLENFTIQRAEIVERPVVNDPGHSQQLEGVALDSIIRAVRRSKS